MRNISKCSSHVERLTENRGSLVTADKAICVNSISYRNPVPQDGEVLEELITEHFTQGSDYDVELGLDDPSTVLRIAEKDGIVVGVMGLTTYDERHDIEEAMFHFQDIEPVSEYDTYGYLHTGYVRQGYTGQGIGSELFEQLRKEGFERGVDVLVADSWFHGGEDSPEKLFEKYDFDVVRTRDISDHAGDDVCPKCGNDCVCGVALGVHQLSAK